MLKENLTYELMYGGYLPRHLIVYGEPQPRPRERLDIKAVKVKEDLRYNIMAVLGMEKENTNFIFSDDALGRYQAIEEKALKAYDRILPFVGRYMNYVISFADILLVSDAIGVSLAKGISPYKWRRLGQLVELKSLIELDKINRRAYEKNTGEVVSVEWLVNLLYSINNRNHTNYLIVRKEYVDRAWEMIQPCLDYVLQLANYVELDKPVAKLMDYMRRVEYSSHSDAMRNTNLNAKQMEVAIRTLVERKDIEVEHKEVTVRGRVYKPGFYKWIGG